MASGVFPVAVAPAMTMSGGAPVTTGSLADRRGHAPTGIPRSAYGPAWSTRTVTSRPTSAGGPGR